MDFDFKKSLMLSAEQAIDIADGKIESAKTHRIQISDNINVKAIRNKINLSRGEFCERYGFKIRTLEKWEQKITIPDSAARAYLTVISSDHRAVDRALRMA